MSIWYKAAIPSVLAITLTACGSSNDDPAPTTTTPPPPASNAAPEATADTASTLNSEAVIIAVLDNDSDADGDTLTLTELNTEGLNGTATIDGNTIVYTPETNALGEETFSYVISDGEESAEAQVTVTNSQQIVLSGIVTDEPVANATVTVSVNDQVFTVQANADGLYTLDFTTSVDDDQLILTGTGEGDQAQVELISILAGISQLLTTRDSNNAITSETNTAVTVSHVSTASAVLFNQQVNSDNGITSYADFTAQLSFEQVMQVAGFIKLLADNAAFPIPDGKTTLSFFENSEASAEGSINQYLADNGFLNADGSPTTEYSDALAAAIDETLLDDALAASFTSEMVANNLFAVYRVRGEYVGFNSETYSFSGDGTGGVDSFGFRNGERSLVRDPYTWSISDGKIALSFNEGNASLSFPSCGSGLQDLFSQAVIEQILQRCADFVGNPQMRTEVRRASSELALLQSNPNANLVGVDSTFEFKVFIDPSSTSEPDFETTYNSTSQIVYSLATESLLASSDDIEGASWALTMPSSVSYRVEQFPEFQYSEQGLMFDIATFGADGNITTTVGGGTGTWSFDTGNLVMNINDTPLVVRPFLNVANSLLAVIAITDAEGTYNIVSEVSPKTADVFDNLTLSTDLPVVWNVMINSHLSSCWSGGQLLIRCVFGFNFDADGTMLRVFDRTNSNDEPFFTTDSLYGFQWTENNDVVTFNAVLNDPNPSFNFGRQRQWHLLNVNENGTLKVLEYGIILQDFNDGVFDINLGEVFPLSPRIQTLIPLDLSTAFPGPWSLREGLGSASVPAFTGDIEGELIH